MRVAESFLDTNVLLYACSAAPEDAGKRQRAGELILEGAFALSAQVLQEFIANALRKPSLGIGESVINATIELASRVPVQPVDLEVVILATTLRRRHQLSHRDATIVAAAQILGCRRLYTEDLSHDEEFDGLRIVDLFR